MTNEMIPFNLEEALKNPDRVVYRNGEKPLEWHWFEKVQQNQECITSVRQDGLLETHFSSGTVFKDGCEDSHNLLLLPLPEKRYWVNVHKEGDLLLMGSIYYTEDLALRQALGHSNYIKTISFTI